MKPDATSQALIRQIAANVTCASCGHHFAARDIELVGKRDHVWAMRVNCRECHTKALLLAVVNQGTARSVETDLVPEDWERFKDSPAISMDDVISVHEFIQAYDGDFTDILEEPLPEE
jgi:ribosomal protein S27E